MGSIVNIIPGFNIGPVFLSAICDTSGQYRDSDYFGRCIVPRRSRGFAFDYAGIYRQQIIGDRRYGAPHRSLGRPRSAQENRRPGIDEGVLKADSRFMIQDSRKNDTIPN